MTVQTPGPIHHAPAVTISASYGAAGSVVAPMLAERLGVPLVDRLLTADVSDDAALADPVPARSGEGATDAEEAATPAHRFFAVLARSAGVGAAVTSRPPVAGDADEDIRRRSEVGLAGVRSGAGAVILGRAGAVLLAARPRTLHVRLDGPAERRQLVAAAIEGISEDRAAERQRRTDRARELWVKRLYRCDPTDPSWYHLWLDTTVLSAADAVDLVASTLACMLAASDPGEGRAR